MAAVEQKLKPKDDTEQIEVTESKSPENEYEKMNTITLAIPEAPKPPFLPTVSRTLSFISLR